MLDGDVVAVIIAEIRRQLELYGIASGDLRVSRSSQPGAQSVGTEKYQVFIQPITNTEIGWSRGYDEPTPDNYTITVNHVKQKTYQIGCITDFNPAVDADIVAQDLAAIVNDMIKQPDAILALKAGGVNILSAGPVRPSFGINESDEYESMPNFDIVVNYNTEYIKTIPIITDVIGEIERI